MKLQRHREADKRWYWKNHEQILAKKALYREKNRNRRRLQSLEYAERIRNEVFVLLGSVCVRCGFDDKRALQIDHINGGGSRENSLIGTYGIRKKILSGSIEGYQLLCSNCNWIKRAENDE